MLLSACDTKDRVAVTLLFLMGESETLDRTRENQMPINLKLFWGSNRHLSSHVCVDQPFGKAQRLVLQQLDLATPYKLQQFCLSDLLSEIIMPASGLKGCGYADLQWRRW